MVVVAGAAVSREGMGCDHSLCLYNKAHLDGYRQLSKTIKEGNCLSILQLMHVGGQGNPAFNGCTPVSPSGIKSKALGFETKELTPNEITEIRDKFIRSAMLANQAGFDGIELHLAHGYLLHEFISKHSNKRKDEYGGNIKNRLRIIFEIISEIKKKRPRFIIGARVSGEDYLENGINEEVNKNSLPWIEKAGIDYFSVTAGTYETSRFKHQAMEKGDFFKYSSTIKSIVKKPVIGVGKILNLDMAEEQLKNKTCDMVAIGRGLITDPALIKKVLNGEEHIECTECDECSYLRFGKTELNCPLNEITCLNEEEFL